jgi:hypothetical protein
LLAVSIAKKGTRMNALDPLELAVLIEKNLISEHGLTEVVLCLRQQQAEMDIVIKLLCSEQISDDLMAYWNPLHSTLKSKLLKAQEK